MNEYLFHQNSHFVHQLITINVDIHHIHGLVQDYTISSAYALEKLQSSTKPSTNPCVHYILITFSLHILADESSFLVLVCYVQLQFSPLRVVLVMGYICAVSYSVPSLRIVLKPA